MFVASVRFRFVVVFDVRSRVQFSCSFSFVGWVFVLVSVFVVARSFNSKFGAVRVSFWDNYFLKSLTTCYFVCFGAPGVF